MISSARRRSAGLVLTLVLALIGAPASSALRNTCDLCPRTCPMHQDKDHSAEKAKAPHMKCHGAPADMARHHAESNLQPEPAGHGPTLGRATCGNHGVVAGSVLPPMILPAALPRLALGGTERAPRSTTIGHRHLADPPDTPPPIGLA